jgi:hypothetical protein
MEMEAGPEGAEYAAPTGLGNLGACVATKSSLLTELPDGARLCPQDQSQRVDGGEALKVLRPWRVWTCRGIGY